MATKATKSAKKTVSPALKIDIGITEKDRAAVAGELARMLADSYTLYLTTHNFHWNVTGPLFNTLHLMFMDQYTEQWEAIDDIAERIRALGLFAPGTYAAFAKLASIEAPEEVLPAEEMIAFLVTGNEQVAKTARKALQRAEKAGDAPSVDLLTRRLEVHEKNAWMLRSLLQ